MNNTVKLIIEIPKKTYLEIREGSIVRNAIASAEIIQNGVPLDDVKAEIHEKMADYVASGYADSAEDFEEYSRIVNQAFDNIGKTESEGE